MVPDSKSDAGSFRAGERILLIDSKDRRHLVTLSEGGRFHSHSGIVDHDDLIGGPDGVIVRSNTGARYTAVRPTLADYVLSMRRGAQVVYPKDLGALLMLADIHSGARVLEAGVGSGAVSLALVRAGADVVGYELRDDFAAVARKNVDGFLGPGAPYRIESRDVYEGIEETGLDRIVLDLPEPWRVVKHAEAALRPGGIFLAYLPTVGQMAQLQDALDHSSFGLGEALEVLHRSWHVKGQSVRPVHRMVGHTGFLICARLLANRD